MTLTLNDAIRLLQRIRETTPGDTELLDADGFAVSSFEVETFEEDSKELNVKAGDTVIRVNSLR